MLTLDPMRWIGDIARDGPVKSAIAQPHPLHMQHRIIKSSGSGNSRTIIGVISIQPPDAILANSND
jgi:hypothetical protein